MQSEETRFRNELTERMENIVEDWKLFAEEYHGGQYADGEHAYGVMNIELTEAINQAQAAANVIETFKENQVMNHKYHDTPKQMAALYDHARFAAEEFAQLAAVALKTIQSGFVRKDVEDE